MTTTPKPPAAEPDDKQQITIRLDVKFDLGNGKSILDATAAAKGLVDAAKEHGEVTGTMVFGRQKFPIT